MSCYCATTKGRSARIPGELNASAKLNNKMVLEIRALYKTGNFPSRALGKLFNISKTTVLRIVSYKAWAHLK